MNNENNAPQALTEEEIQLVAGGIRGDLDCTGQGWVTVYTTPNGGGQKCDS